MTKSLVVVETECKGKQIGRVRFRIISEASGEELLPFIEHAHRWQPQARQCKDELLRPSFPVRAHLSQRMGKRIPAHAQSSQDPSAGVKQRRSLRRITCHTELQATVQ